MAEKESKDTVVSHEKQIVLRVTSRVLERTIFIVIIAILLIVIIFQNTGSLSLFGGDNQIKKPVEKATTTTEAAESSAENTTINVTTTLSDSQKASDGELKGNVNLSFAGDPVVSSTGKVTKISFTIVNSGPAFRPRIKFYFYDDDTFNIIKNDARATWESLTPIENGQTLNNFYSAFTPSFVNKADKEEIFVMKLYNRDTGIEIISETKTIIVN